MRGALRPFLQSGQCKSIEKKHTIKNVGILIASSKPRILSLSLIFFFSYSVLPPERQAAAQFSAVGIIYLVANEFYF
jgi:hypothetical protein